MSCCSWQAQFELEQRHWQEALVDHHRGNVNDTVVEELEQVDLAVARAESVSCPLLLISFFGGRPCGFHVVCCPLRACARLSPLVGAIPA